MMEMIMESRLTDPKTVKAFALAGKAHFTLRSQKTGNRFTYRVKKSSDGRVWFVGVLTGSDNDSMYTYMGVVRGSLEFQFSAKSKVDSQAPSATAFVWFWRHVVQAGVFPDGLEIWHEGRCGRCARRLTVPESISSGFGPECINYVCEET